MYKFVGKAKFMWASTIVAITFHMLATSIAVGGIEALGEKLVEQRVKKYARPMVTAYATRLVGLPSGSQTGENIVYSIGLEQSEENKVLVKSEEASLRKALAKKETGPLLFNITMYQFGRKILPTKKGRDRSREKMLQSFGRFARVMGPPENYAHYFMHTKIDRYILSGINKGSQIPWIYRPNVSLVQVYDDFANDRVANALFIVHGDDNGIIYDTQGNRFDPGFFKIVSPQVHSLAFFSCHGDRIADSYQFAELPPESVYPERLVFTIPASRKLNGDALALSPGIKTFIRQVSQTLRMKSDEGLTRQTEEMAAVRASTPYQHPRECALRLSNFNSGATTFALHLNRAFVGVLQQTEVMLPVECALLLENEENLLLVSNPHKRASYQGDVPIGEQHPQLVLYRKGRPVPIDVHYEHLSRAASKTLYRSSKISFQLRS